MLQRRQLRDRIHDLPFAADSLPVRVRAQEFAGSVRGIQMTCKRLDDMQLESLLRQHRTRCMSYGVELVAFVFADVLPQIAVNALVVCRDSLLMCR